jgi:hypothetical protein
MTKVFIAGSRQLGRLNADVKQRIDGIVAKGFTILVGDANGADKAVQKYLAEKPYRNVIVHCIARNCRNNIGQWSQHDVTVPKGAKGFAYYAVKDLVMVDEAAYGLMIWDGESKGTLNSIVNMIRRSKPVVVYLAPRKRFQNLRSTADLGGLLSQCDATSVQRLERELGLDALPRSMHS